MDYGEYLHTTSTINDQSVKIAERYIPPLVYVYFLLKPHEEVDSDIKLITSDLEETFNSIDPLWDKTEELGLLLAAAVAYPTVKGVYLLTAGAAALIAAGSLTSEDFRSSIKTIIRKTKEVARRTKERVQRKTRQGDPPQQKPKTPGGPPIDLGQVIKHSLYASAILIVALSEGGQSVLTGTGKAVEKAPSVIYEVAKYGALALVGYALISKFDNE